MAVLLIDPRLLTPPPAPGCHFSGSVDYWESVIKWSGDPRAQLGIECWKLLSERFAEYGYPEHNLPIGIPALRGAAHRAIYKIMARVLLPHRDPAERRFVPRYKGSDDENLALQMDISSTAGNNVVGIATISSSWDDDPSSVEVQPEPPPTLSICLTPGQELTSEREGYIEAFLRNKRIFLVGGRRDEAIVQRLVGFGVAQQDVIWTPCEKAKPPRNLDGAWGSLAPDRDITICITGRVGHATSDKAKVIADRRGVYHLRAETCKEALADLLDYALSSQDR